jgi:FMN phosphatase YigB (HAD superfamily)
MPKVLAFDCVGTVFSTANVPAEDMRSYVGQVQRPEWSPLGLRNSFLHMRAHADAAEGIARLRKKYRVVTCSNLPLDVLHLLSCDSGIRWDAIVPLEASQAYKPRTVAYITVCHVLQVDAEDVTVVTAHANGPDIEGAPAAGMQVKLIRNPGCPQTIIELAEELGA